MKIAAAALAPILVLAGCVAAPPPSPPSPQPSTSETRDAVEPVLAGPVPYLDLRCQDLVSAATLESSVVETIELMPIAEFRELSWYDVPRGSAVRQVGGFTCEWSNGIPQSDDDRHPDYRGIYVSVLPDAAEQWLYYGDYLEAGATSAQNCNVIDTTVCEYNGLINGSWVLVQVTGATGEATTSIDAVVADVLAALASAEPASTHWVPDAGTQDAALDCPALQTVVEASLGPVTGPEDSGGGWSQEASSWSMLGVGHENACILSTERGYVYASGVTGAEWAWMEALASGRLSSASQFTTASMGPGEAAWTVCDGNGCAVHVIASHSWIRADLRSANASVDVDAVLRSLAEEITRQVHAD